jgi:phage terminase small subunit
MPDKKGRFSPQEQRFIGLYVESGNGAYAAEKAGYSQAAAAATKNLQKPAVVAEVQKLQRERLVNEALPLAINRLIGQLQDKNVVGAPLNKAIELTLKYGGAVADEAQGKEPHEMSGEELARAIDTLERAAMAKAKPVEAVPEPSILD